VKDGVLKIFDDIQIGVWVHRDRHQRFLLLLLNKNMNSQIEDSAVKASLICLRRLDNIDNFEVMKKMMVQITDPFFRSKIASVTTPVSSVSC
jgi:hypothetical protein